MAICGTHWAGGRELLELDLELVVVVERKAVTDGGTAVTAQKWKRPWLSEIHKLSEILGEIHILLSIFSFERIQQGPVTLMPPLLPCKDPQSLVRKLSWKTRDCGSLHGRLRA